MKFPYGLADFYSLRKEGYFYQDRTRFIRLVEERGKQLVFLRPRRSGKSLWISTLANYYDLARAQDFAMLFDDLAIGQNPTPLHNHNPSFCTQEVHTMTTLALTQNYRPTPQPVNRWLMRRE